MCLFASASTCLRASKFALMQCAASRNVWAATYSARDLSRREKWSRRRFPQCRLDRCIMSVTPIVETRPGKVRGSIEPSILEETFYAFKGIPYAAPPVGQLRFQDPVPAKPWIGERDCTNFGPVCAQLDWVTNSIIGVDDCLYLNVYSKSIDSSLRRPVIVWIHGGGFVTGYSNDNIYGPDYLLQKDVVVVTINYRLGVLGFLNLEDEVAPGNQGLKDQVLALQWVRDNIASFGGNPGNVTIMGESAGGASVHYLCISRLARGLFHKAIAQSGVILNPWANITENPRRFAYKMCELLGHKTREPKAIVDFLRKIDAQKLIKVQDKLLTEEERLQLFFPFGPGIDAKSKAPFMPVNPEIAYKTGVQVPLLIGFCNKEGLLFVKSIEKNYSKFNTDLERHLHPNIVKLIKKYNMSSKDLRRLYCNNEEINEENRESIIEMLGDMQFVEGVHRVVKTQIEKSCASTYLYRFSYNKEMSSVKLAFDAGGVKGACHADDLGHLFRSKVQQAIFSDRLTKGTVDYKIMEQMTDMWLNFATTGIPTPELTETVPMYWQPVNNEIVLRYLNIDYDLRMEIMLNLDQRFLPYKSLKNKF